MRAKSSSLDICIRRAWLREHAFDNQMSKVRPGGGWRILHPVGKLLMAMDSDFDRVEQDRHGKGTKPLVDEGQREPVGPAIEVAADLNQKFAGHIAQICVRHFAVRSRRQRCLARDLQL
jgi:hypothetical protein